MTDPLTDAVRRLKGLQEDVERLKSAQDEEGEPRILFSEAETAVVTQGFGLRSQSLTSDAFYNDAGYQTATVDAVDIVRPRETETASADDSQSLRSSNVTGTATYSDTSGYNTATYNA
jgi:hypothetical protein